MSSNLLQVVSECAFVTQDTPSGRAKVLVMKGAIFPADAPEARHLLDSGMAVPVGGGVSGGLNADGEPAASAAGDAPKTHEAPRSTPKTPGGDKADRSDLDGLRARAVAAGMDKAEVAKASEADLRAVLK